MSEFSLDLKSRSKDELLEGMIEEGITFDMMNDALSKRKLPVEEGEAPSFTKKDDVTLIKMSRSNPTFRFRGYKFTKEHPFVLMNEDDAIDILIMERGFSRASVAEAEEYYGRS